MLSATSNRRQTRATVARLVIWRLQAESEVCLFAQLTSVVFPLES